MSSPSGNNTPTDLKGGRKRIGQKRLDQLDPELVDMIKRDEGFRDKPYKCTAGRVTIGWGHNLDDKGLPFYMLEDLLVIDIRDAIGDVKGLIGQSIWEGLSSNRKNVLINMCFNLGKVRLGGFKRMLKAVHEGDFNGAASEMEYSAWFAQVGDRAKRLVKLMKEG